MKYKKTEQECNHDYGYTLDSKCPGCGKLFVIKNFWR